MKSDSILKLNRKPQYLVEMYSHETIIEKALELSKELMDRYNDESHDFGHVLRVRENLLESIKCGRQKFGAKQKLRMELGAILHDVRDSKYQDTKQISEERLREYLENWVGPYDARVVLDICENVSWSRFMRGETKDLGYHNIELWMVQDADKLDALGAQGGLRCWLYQQKKGKKLPQMLIWYDKERVALYDGHWHTEYAIKRYRKGYKDLKKWIKLRFEDYVVSLILKRTPLKDEQMNEFGKVYIMEIEFDRMEEKRKEIVEYVHSLDYEELMRIVDEQEN
jgi:HD superfamily phosphodiesterase